jgi:t-SNARE complex subunit (syntaxin)
MLSVSTVNPVVGHAIASVSDGFEQLKSKFDVSLTLMEGVLEREKFEELWGGMATGLQVQILKLDEIAAMVSEMEKEVEDSMLMAQRLEVEATKHVSLLQKRVDEFSSQMDGLNKQIEWNTKDIADENARVASAKASVERKIKEREDAALSIIPGYGIMNCIFRYGSRCSHDRDCN